jgi:HK97 family phage major capsid protein
MKIQELRAKLAALKAEGQKQLTAIKALEAEIAKLEAAGADVTAQKASLAEQVKAGNKIADDIEATQDAIDDVERRARLEKAVASSSRTPAGVIAVGLSPEDRNGGFRSMADFGRAVRAACTPGGNVDPRLNEMRRRYGEQLARERAELIAAGALTEGGLLAAPTSYHQEGGAAEGYMVPPDFRNDIWTLVAESEEPDLFSMTNPEPTESNQVDMLRDESTPWGSVGVTFTWRSEAAQMSAKKLATKATTTRLGEGYVFVIATEELLEDAPRLNDRLTTKSAAAIKWGLSEAVFRGDGVGKPTGIVTHPSRVTVTRNTSASIVTADISGMMSHLLASSYPRAVWLFNPDVLPQIVNLQIGSYPIWTPINGGLREGAFGNLMGRPMYPTEHSDTLGNEGDLVLWDPSGYYSTRKSSGVNFASSMHLYFDYNMTAFRWTIRAGGQPYLSAAVSPNKGSTKKSHTVTLSTK